MRFWLPCVLATLSLLALPLAGQADDATISITVAHPKGSTEYSAPVEKNDMLSVEDAMKAAGMQFTVTWYPKLPGYAAVIIDGDPPLTTGGFFKDFWWLCINGASSQKGMGHLLRPGDKVLWSWVRKAEGVCPND